MRHILWVVLQNARRRGKWFRGKAAVENSAFSLPENRAVRCSLWACPAKKRNKHKIKPSKGARRHALRFCWVSFLSDMW